VLIDWRRWLKHTGDVLHVMADFMGQNIGLRKVARRPELVTQLIVEPKVDINLLIVRAIERPRAGVRIATSGVHRVREQHHGWRRIGLVLLGELCGPQILGFLDDHANKIAQIVFRAAGWRLDRRPRRCGGAASRRGAAAAAATDDVHRIGAGHDPDDPEHDDDAENAADTAARPAATAGREPEPATAATTERAATEPAAQATATLTAAIFNIGALLPAAPLHARPS
jgi:hypothetical protein